MEAEADSEAVGAEADSEAVASTTASAALHCSKLDRRTIANKNNEDSSPIKSYNGASSEESAATNY